MKGLVVGISLMALVVFSGAWFGCFFTFRGCVMIKLIVGILVCSVVPFTIISMLRVPTRWGPIRTIFLALVLATGLTVMGVGVAFWMN